MKLKKLIKKLKEIYKEHGNLECVYSIDDEGNSFHKIAYEPTEGYYSSEDYEFRNDQNPINAVCIN